MEISIMQAILLALVSGFCFSGALLGIYTHRVIVLSFFVGLILGDVQTGLMMGAIGELAFMGFGVGAGGTVPPNPLGPGVVGTIMAITLKNQGITPESALALSYPFAVLFQLIQTFLYTLSASTPEAAKKAIRDGKYKLFTFYSHGTFIGFFITGAVIAFAAAYSLEAFRAFVDLIPEQLVTALSIAGGLLPAIGFATILSVMVTKEVIPYIILGYIAVSFLDLPVMAIALVGLVFALIDYNNKQDNKEVIQEIEEGEEYGI